MSTFQYQGQASPVELPTPQDTTTQSHTSVEQVIEQVFQYQEAADVPVENASTEWYQPIAQPLRRAKPPIHNLYHYDLRIERYAEADATQEWYTQHPIPVLRVPQTAFRFHFNPSIEREAETDATTEWYTQHPIPVLRVPSMTGRDSFDGAVRVPQSELDKTVEWLMQHPIPVLRIPNTAFRHLFTGDVLRARRRVQIPPLVVHDPKASTRTREHEQYVARILNSLFMQGELVQEAGPVAGGKWHIGVYPTTPTDWLNDDPPTTLTEFLHRLAAVMAALGYKI